MSWPDAPAEPDAGAGRAEETPAADESDLNNFINSVDLNRLNLVTDPEIPQPLSGDFIELSDIDLPTIPPPEEEDPDHFCYSSVTDNFSAVNAYYHLNEAYQMLENMGFNTANYFDGTQFPIPVDHRGKGGARNASCEGNATNDGTGKYLFGLAQAGRPVGIAADRRVVLHEFGHALLWDHVSWPNFGFAHSAGDSIAVILSDPDSRAPDRGLSFPFPVPTLDRRHDRDVATWAWGGNNDNGHYDSEQILSTTLFRLYQAFGGADHDIDIRRFAARYIVYLIVAATGTLTSVTNPNDPEDFAQELMHADRDTIDFEGHPGGAVHKLIRWSFERQGAYQPPAAVPPHTTPGAPPEVDVFIDDGRNGEYEYLPNFENTMDVWNRLEADGSQAHQVPDVLGHNFLYTRIRNRGTQHADNVVVKVYQGRAGSDLVWPDDWDPLITEELAVNGGIASEGQAVVGPFEWQPAREGHVSILISASADGDPSNADTVMGVPHWRLVPFDNNIAIRNLSPAEYRPNIRLRPVSIYFGNVCTGGSLTKTVTIKNIGMVPLSVTEMSVDNRRHFSVHPRQGDKPCRGWRPTIQPRSHCTIGVRYEPQIAGSHSSYLLVYSDDPDMPVARIALNGFSQPSNKPRFDVIPPDLDFGSIQVGRSSKPRFLSLRNIGMRELRLRIAPIKQVHWSMNFQGGFQPCGSAFPHIESCDYCSISAKFKPRSRGVKRGEIIIWTNDPDNSQVRIPLKGRGV